MIIRALSGFGENTRKQSIALILMAAAISSSIVAFQFTYILFAILYFGAMSENLKAGFKPDRSIYTILFAVFVVLSLVFYLIHSDQSLSDERFQRTLELTGIFCFTMMVMDAVGQRARMPEFDFQKFAILGIGLSLVFVIGKTAFLATTKFDGNILQSFIGDGRRLNFFTNNPNHADDLVLLIVITMIWYSALSRSLPTFLKFVVAGMVLMFGSFFVVTQSLGGVLGALVGIFIVLAISISRLPKSKRILAAFLLVVATVSFFTGLGLTENPFSRALKQVGVMVGETTTTPSTCNIGGGELPQLGPQYQDDKSTAYRFITYANGLKIWAERPLVGHGTFDREYFADSVTGVDQCVMRYFAHSHNLYIDIMIRGGLLLLFVYVALICAWLYYLLTLLRRAEDPRAFVAVQTVVFFTVFLLVENLFDLTFIYASALKANLLILVGMTAITAEYLKRQGNARTTK